MEPESVAIAHAIKQRRESIYTLTNDHGVNLETERDILQRRMSRLSRKSSGRSNFGGTVVVPVTSNISASESSKVATVEVVQNQRNNNDVLSTPTYQVYY